MISFAAKFPLRVCIVAALAWGSLASTLLAQPAKVPKGTGLSVVRRITLNEKAGGYRGIWNRQSVTGSRRIKYSGGMATHSSKHQEFAVYCPQVNKTFFCFGGTEPDNDIHLLHMVACFDHQTGMVSRPTILLDKKTSDVHENPSLTVDSQGHIWVLSPSSGSTKACYVHRSKRPWDVDEFELVVARRNGRNRDRFLANFSHSQIFCTPGNEFSCFLTRYNDLAVRTCYFMSSQDGRYWNNWKPLAAIQRGHYQIAEASPTKLATMMNYHPSHNGYDGRTNLYYMQSLDRGKSWQSADGQEIELPLTAISNKALVRNYASESQLVFLKDLAFDSNGDPVLLYLTSHHANPGPAGDPRVWMVACRDQGNWRFSTITRSDHNYDHGSLDIRGTTWRLLAPTDPGPYPGYTGGGLVLWESDDRGATWRKAKQLTQGIGGNHSYCRLVANADDAFYALWSDGNPSSPSRSDLYFCNRSGDIFRLPRDMPKAFAQPVRVTPVEAD